MTFDKWYLSYSPLVTTKIPKGEVSNKNLPPDKSEWQLISHNFKGNSPNHKSYKSKNVHRWPMSDWSNEWTDFRWRLIKLLWILGNIVSMVSTLSARAQWKVDFSWLPPPLIEHVVTRRRNIPQPSKATWTVRLRKNKEELYTFSWWLWVSKYVFSLENIKKLK